MAGVSLLGAFAVSHQRDVLERFSSLPLVLAVIERTSSMLRLDTIRGRLAVNVTAPEHLGAALVWHTGSTRHIAALGRRASRMGLVFADGQLRRSGGPALAVPDEEALYRHLDLPYIPPELREGRGEIAAAARGRLPGLVSTAHVRGDLHLHTIWSDGRDTVESMVLAARALGYQYVAITDHSERSSTSRNLRAADVHRQGEEIDAVRESVPGIAVLHGVEVDIMPDASLAYDDSILERLDIVLASLHDSAGHSRTELTRRYVAAIRHPLVNVITHLANRSPALSEGYDLDVDRIFAEAARTGTALEIDGAPGHLDMDGFLARRAVEFGATVTIDSDSHRSDALARQMRFGVGTAGRGWIEPRHVLNTRPFDAVRDFVGAKRSSVSGVGGVALPLAQVDTDPYG
jgi:DNA polymerase (family X)